jgi:plastocyanin
MRIRIVLVIGAALLMGISACGNDDSGNPVSPPPSSEHKTVVQIRDNVFSPKDLTISVGDTVEWVNVGNNQHTTTSGSGCAENGLWNSGTLSNNQKFMVIFDAGHVSQTGTIPYFCIPHCALNMTGSVTVNP